MDHWTTGQVSLQQGWQLRNPSVLCRQATCNLLEPSAMTNIVRRSLIHPKAAPDTKKFQLKRLSLALLLLFLEILCREEEPDILLLKTAKTLLPSLGSLRTATGSESSLIREDAPLTTLSSSFLLQAYHSIPYLFLPALLVFEAKMTLVVLLLALVTAHRDNLQPILL